MGLLLVSTDRFGHHLTPPGHPERPERAQVLDAVATAWRKGGGAVAAPRPASRDELTAVHAAGYLDDVAATAGRATMLDPDTFTSPESYEIARLAAGAVLVAIEHTLGDRGPALALVRPPGHHAERDKAMGFCLFNNAAVGAAYARARGVARVAVMDFDVHHGNGTQWMFYDDPSVLYLSTHQFPFYPGTGAASEVGRGEGRGRTVNVPLEAGSTDDDYRQVLARVVEPTLAEFQPGLILVSAGYDADGRDPLAQMRLTTAGFRAIVASLWRSASSLCAGRLVAVTEGGYDLQAFGAGLDATVEVLSAPPAPAPPAPAAEAGGSGRGGRAVAAVLDAQKPFWRRL